jgi:hypothetical protein
MIEKFQRLTKVSGRDRFEIAFWVINLLLVILAPVTFLVFGLAQCLAWLFVESTVSLFAGAMENKGRDDPVYKKNLHRLIERNRRFEEARE